MKKSQFLKVVFLVIALSSLPTILSATKISSILDTAAPVVPDGVTSVTTGTMAARLFRSGGIGGSCDSPKPAPMDANIAGTYRYDTYTITPTVTGCVTVKTQYYGGSSQFQVTAYSTFNPADIKANFLADPASSTISVGSPVFISFLATAGTPYTIVVWNPISGIEGTPYHFTIGDSIARAGDFDGDGHSDTVVFRPSNGVWYILQSSDSVVRFETFGASGDVPIDGDFDGDGLSDLCIFRPSAGTWYFKRSHSGLIFGATFGTSTDKPVPGDYDKDGITDIAFFSPTSLGNNWYVLRSKENFTTYFAYPFGANGDIPVVSERKP